MILTDGQADAIAAALAEVRRVPWADYTRLVRDLAWCRKAILACGRYEYHRLSDDPQAQEYRGGVWDERLGKLCALEVQARSAWNRHDPEAFATVRVRFSVLGADVLQDALRLGVRVPTPRRPGGGSA